MYEYLNHNTIPDSARQDLRVFKVNDSLKKFSNFLLVAFKINS